MSIWSLYRESDGHFVGVTLSMPEHLLASNIPEGHRAMPGEHDHLSCRVEGGVVVDWQPPKPSPDHEWHEDLKRWVKKADVLAREQKVRDAHSRIEQLERSQHRAIREAALGQAGAADRLKAIDQEISELRGALGPDV